MRQRDSIAALRSSQQVVARAKELRQTATPAEELLWQFLRRRQLHAFKFRRQHPIGNFITDFSCAEAKLIIEIDGAVHQEATHQERDRLRTEVLQQYGFTLLRFNNRKCSLTLTTC